MDKQCDRCDKSDYTAENPRVFLCQQRPSDKSEMCCTLAGHKNCMGAENTTLPSIHSDGGIATVDQWEDWIESPAAYKAGYLFLSL